MKIITLNARKGIKAVKITAKLLIFVLVLTFCVNISSLYFESTNTYVEAAAELTDKKTVIIDAGHGGEDCGAIGATGVYEKDLNLEVANTLGSMLSEKGYAVIYTRTEDKLLYTDEENIKGIRKISDLKNRCKIGAEYKDALFISIHMNSFSEEKYSGTHVYYSDNNDSSYKLATAVQSKVKDTLQPDNNRVVKSGKDIYLLEHLDNTAILVECGFITNVEECKKLSEKEYQKELSFAILCGIIEYIENN